MYSENAGIIAIGILIVGIIGSGVFLTIHDADRVDAINRNFANRCYAVKGDPVIADKDLCIKDGKILFHE